MVRTYAVWPTVACVVALATVWSGSAHAEEGPIELMAEPTAYTDVADAFDGPDPFDINVRLGFVWSSASATVERETTDAMSADGRPSRRFVGVAEHQRTRNSLEMALEIGLYQDLMLFAGLPVVLAETRELREPGGADCASDPTSDGCLRLTSPLADGTREPLFEVGSPLLSAKRSGLPRIDLGVAWGVTNQHRTSLLPTWVLRMALSIPTKDVMEPCIRGGASCEPGISNGQGGLTIGSRWSYRFRHVEPLMGLSHTFSWISSGDGLYRPAGTLDGMAEDGPPSRSELTLGAVVIPWEDRGRHQRFALDTRASATVVSDGRDISPLFDALGASDSAQLTTANVDNLSLGASDRETVMFTGVTRVEAHARVALRTALVIQAARYVRFNLGMGFTHVTPHLLTGEPVCNTDIDVRSNDPRGGLCVRGLPNPAHRPVIDAPGNRFRLGSGLQVDLFAVAAGQF